MTIMSFQRIYEDILKKVLDHAENLHNKDLIEFIHKSAQGVDFDFTKCDYDKWKEAYDKKVTVEEATNAKDEGTKLFRSGKLQEALETYTKYLELCHAVEDHGNLAKPKMLYQGYANRSIVLFKACKVSNFLLIFTVISNFFQDFHFGFVCVNKRGCVDNFHKRFRNCDLFIF